MSKNKLKKDDYLEWKLSIANINSFENKVRIQQLERKLLEKEIQLYNNEIREKVRKENELTELRKKKEEEFNELRKKLEEKVGIPFDKAVIDEVTLEVKQI
jgi:Zn-dependent M32 family carboxypeptidase